MTRRLLLMLVLTITCVNSKNKGLAEQFKRQIDCMKNMQFNENQRHVQVLVVARGSDVVLPCFQCISPEDAVEIESTYKPSAGSIGRVYRKVVDFFKKRLSARANILDENKWKYDWEFANPGRPWSDLTSIHKKKQKAEVISEKIKRFLSRDKTSQSLGDRYELNLFNINANQTGFYRCVNKQKKLHRIGSAYFLDVQSMSDIRMVSSGSEELKEEVNALPDESLITDKLVIKPKSFPWSVCSRCGSNITGQQTRLIECHIESTSKYLDNQPESSDWIRLFGSVPCSSSVVPLKLRKEIGEVPKVLEYRACQTKCSESAAENRNITSLDELGEVRVMDFIPKGEYIFGEILPRLLPPVVRKGHLVVEGDPIVFSCNTNPDEPTGIQWHTQNILNLDIDEIKKIYQDRVVMDENSRLLFHKVEISDTGFYYCYNTEKVLIGVHNLIVIENERTREIIANMEMLLRFTVFTFICVMILTRLLK